MSGTFDAALGPLTSLAQRFLNWRAEKQTGTRLVESELSSNLSWCLVFNQTYETLNRDPNGMIWSLLRELRTRDWDAHREVLVRVLTRDEFNTVQSAYDAQARARDHQVLPPGGQPFDLVKAVTDALVIISRHAATAGGP